MAVEDVFVMRVADEHHVIEVDAQDYASQLARSTRMAQEELDAVIAADVLTAVVLLVSKAVRQERTRRRDRPGRQMEMT